MSELSKLQAGAADFIVEIADVLAKVPRSVLLLMKTNDLLKSIEKALKVPLSLSPFKMSFLSFFQLSYILFCFLFLFLFW